METSYIYETTVIINAALEDSQIEAVFTRAQEQITKNGGEITALNNWGRKRLVFPIKKKNNGYYYNIEFRGPGSIVKQLEHSYLLEEQILRFLTIRLDKKALKARELAKLAAPPEVAAVPVIAEIKPLPERPIDKVPLFDEEP